MGVIVTVRSLETAPGANDTVALPSALVIVPPVAVTTPDPGTGGERPLLVFAFGSGVLASQDAGAVDGSLDCVDVVVVVVVAPVPPEPAPALPLVPATVCVLGHDVTLVVPVVVLVAAVVVATALLESLMGATLGSIVPLVPVVAVPVVEVVLVIVVVVVAMLLETVPVSVLPTVACSVVGAVDDVVVPDEV
jgi:hypothetical protein